LQVLSKLNLDELCGIAISCLHLSVDEFYDLAPIEFKYALKTDSEREIDRFKTKYEVARYIVRHIWNSAGKTIKRGHEYKEAKDVGLFGWEQEEILSKEQSVDDIKSTLLGIARSFNKRFDKKKK